MSAAAKFMSIVTDDLLHEILVRIPDFRSAARCSSVCKRWHSLISDPKFVPSFIHHHHHRRRSFERCCELPFPVQYAMRSLDQMLSEKTEIYYGLPCYYLAQEVPRELRRAAAAAAEEEEFGYIRASYKDLVLVSYGKSDYYLCNPLTRRWLALPKPPADDYPLWIGLAFESSPPGRCEKGLESCECGITSGGGSRFRVLVVTHSGTINPLLFCSETGEWSDLVLPSIFDFGWVRPEVFASDGVFYLLGLKDRRRLIAFDPFKGSGDPKRCRFFKLPDRNVEGARGHVCFVQEVLGVVRSRVRLAQLFKVRNVVKPASGFALARNVVEPASGFAFALKVWEFDHNGIGDESRPRECWRLVHNVGSEMADTSEVFVEAFHPDNGGVIFLLSDHGFCRYEISGDEFESVCCVCKIPHLGRHDITYVHPVWPTAVPSLSHK